ncbi:hypothetical protein BCR34DRAFT_604488 [Clohesyomyces aquaticus]|uniref:Uncharacterized protein n=1 Tax=Clohesyomyces aquaticus TaxID=1231657 RepID=A0A1Y1Z612_9PLEO|nr:hypothetical protein BCR34DRAFT_604488 [Clohesyomyces aquaticus]
MPTKNLDFMSDVCMHFVEDLKFNGCIEVPSTSSPTLTNTLHPFIKLDRWPRGYDQHTHRIFEHMRPALQLASLLLTEDCTLPWFHHVTWGYGLFDKQKDPTMQRFFIAATKKEHEESGDQRTRQKQLDLAKASR